MFNTNEQLSMGFIEVSNKEEILKKYNALKQSDFSETIKRYVPSQEKSITQIYDYISNLYEKYDEVIVFALDAISFDFYMNDIYPHFRDEEDIFVQPLASVFPTTSSTAWTSILTGSTPSKHGVYGTSFFHENFNKNYLWLNNSILHKGFIETIKSNTESLNIIQSRRPILFKLLQESKIKSFSFGVKSVGEELPFLTELMCGANVMPLEEPYQDFVSEPDKMIDYFLLQTEMALGDKTRKKMIWNYIDFDGFIHQNGYQVLKENVTWNRIRKFWCDNKKSNRVFLLISDHGQIEQNKNSIDILKESEKNDDLACNTGGAGRTLYFYPQKDKLENVKEWLVKIIKDSGDLFLKKDLISLGLLEENHICSNRIGDLIAIAKSPNFLSTGVNFHSEHGALTRQEVYVPMMIQIEK